NAHALEALPEVDAVGLRVEAAGRLLDAAAVARVDHRAWRDAATQTDEHRLGQRVAAREDDEGGLDGLGGRQGRRAGGTAWPELGYRPGDTHRIARTHRRRRAAEDEDALRRRRVGVRLGILHVEAVVSHGGDDPGNQPHRLAVERRDVRRPLDVVNAR